MTRDDPSGRGGRAEPGREALVTAMLELAREGRAEHVSVSSLCTRAAVSRPTFYQHFSSPEDLLADAVRRRLDDAAAATRDPGSDDVPSLVAALLTEIGSDPSAYRGMLADPAMFGRVRAALETWVTERLAALVPDADRLALAFVAGGVARTLALWLEPGGEDLDPAVVDSAIRRMARDVLVPGCPEPEA